MVKKGVSKVEFVIFSSFRKEGRNEGRTEGRDDGGKGGKGGRKEGIEGSRE